MTATTGESTTQRRRKQLLRTMRVVGASLMLTMRLFQELPVRDARPDVAIVREWIRTGRFDPRERIAGGVVLTLPYSPEHRRRRRPEIGRN